MTGAPFCTYSFSRDKKRGAVISQYREPSAADRPEDVADDVREADLEQVLKFVPRGALALAGIMVVILILAWLFIYFGVFIPRGPVN